MAAEQSLTKYAAGEGSSSMTQPQPTAIIVEDQVQMEAWNALYREHQRFRQQIVQLNTTAFNNHRAYQQLIIQFNKLRNDLARANQDLAVLQGDLDQERAIVDFGKQQLDLASNALQQEIGSRLQAEECRREEHMKVQMLVAIVTRLDIITAEDLEFILGDEVDVNAVLNDPITHASDTTDPKALLRQATFTLQCYKDLAGQLKEQNESLFHAVEEKNAEMKALRVDFGQDYSEGEDTPE